MAGVRCHKTQVLAVTEALYTAPLHFPDMVIFIIDVRQMHSYLCCGWPWQVLWDHGMYHGKLSCIFLDITDQWIFNFTFYYSHLGYLQVLLLACSNHWYVSTIEPKVL